MNNDFLQDSKGNKSSKRLWGSILLSIGIIFSVILFIFSVSVGVADPITAGNVINMFLISGSSLLGIGVLEKVINTEKK